MASRTLSHLELEPRKVTKRRRTASFSYPPTASSLYVAPVFTELAQGLKISRRAALGGARGAMAAIGLEAGAVLCCYGIWQLWRLL
jgi:hypothetical protein